MSESLAPAPFIFLSSCTWSPLRAACTHLLVCPSLSRPRTRRTLSPSTSRPARSALPPSPHCSFEFFPHVSYLCSPADVSGMIASDLLLQKRSYSVSLRLIPRRPYLHHLGLLRLRLVTHSDWRRTSLRLAFACFLSRVSLDFFPSCLVQPERDFCGPPLGAVMQDSFCRRNCAALIFLLLFVLDLPQLLVFSSLRRPAL